jgi:hypothetical protein
MDECFENECLLVCLEKTYTFSKNMTYKVTNEVTNTPSLLALFNSNVTTKYQEASKIVNLALQGLVGQCLPGAKVIDLCEFGHTVINQACAKLYTKKVNGQTVDRGIAFPVCISVNDVVCNHSPLLSEEKVSCLDSSCILFI